MLRLNSRERRIAQRRNPNWKNLENKKGESKDQVKGAQDNLSKAEVKPTEQFENGRISHENYYRRMAKLVEIKAKLSSKDNTI